MSAQNHNLITAASQEKINFWLSKFPPERRQSALIPALTIVQEQNGGWLTKPLLDAVADYLDLPKISVYEVATFYSMLEIKPEGEVGGKYKIAVCTNVPCMLSGSEKVVDHLCQRLQINPGETTTDGKFSLKQVECLGACVAAPVMQVNRDYYENLTPEKIDHILDGLE